MRIGAAIAMLAYGCGSLNVLGGPVFGYRLSGPPKDRALLGFECGIGASVERINVGIDHNPGRTIYYFELDPWFFLGGTLGLAFEPTDKDVDVHPLLGLWEGIPIILTEPADCLDKPDDRTFYPTITVSLGYRYNGEHELYVAPKVGGAQKPYICF